MKIFDIIYNMYQNVQTYIKHDKECCGDFHDNIYIKKGENLVQEIQNQRYYMHYITK
jgi:hypothetical protein